MKKDIILNHFERKIVLENLKDEFDIVDLVLHPSFTPMKARYVIFYRYKNLLFDCKVELRNYNLGNMSPVSSFIVHCSESLKLNILELEEEIFSRSSSDYREARLVFNPVSRRAFEFLHTCEFLHIIGKLPGDLHFKMLDYATELTKQHIDPTEMLHNIYRTFDINVEKYIELIKSHKTVIRNKEEEDE